MIKYCWRSYSPQPHITANSSGARKIQPFGSVTKEKWDLYQYLAYIYESIDFPFMVNLLIKQFGVPDTGCPIIHGGEKTQIAQVVVL